MKHLEEVRVKSLRQIVPASGLWLKCSDETDETFLPIVGIAHLEVDTPESNYFTDSVIMPITSEDLMYGLIERFPFTGLRFSQSIYHEVDFEEIGVRLKPNARERRVPIEGLDRPKG